MIFIRRAVVATASLLIVLAVVPSIAMAQDQNADTDKKKKNGDQKSEQRQEKHREQGSKGPNVFGKPIDLNKSGGSANGEKGGFGKSKQTFDKPVGDNGKNNDQSNTFKKFEKPDNKFGGQDNNKSNNKFGDQDKNNKSNNKFGDQDKINKSNNKFGDQDNNKAEFKKHFGKDNGTSDKPVVINPLPLNKGTTAGGSTSDKSFGAGDARKRFENMKSARREKAFDGGKGLVIEEPGKRTIFKTNNKLVIQHDETERLRRVDPNARFEKGKGGTNISIIDRGNAKIYSETDANGQLLRRYRRGPDGRDVVIIDNRRRHRHGNGIATGIGIGIGVVAGAVILDSVLDVPEPRVRIPRDKYIVDYDQASDEDVYEALNAPPVEEFNDRYSLDEIRATARLRDRMRRVDLDDITFEFGSWEVDPGQYGKLERIARAMQRVIDRNPNEVFLIEGYTDAVGSPEDNLSLSDRRAESVAEVLSEQFKVPFENLTTQGYGEEYLKVATDGPERLNRRVAVRRITPLLSHDNGPPAAERSDLERSDARDNGGPDDRSDRDAPDGPDARDGADAPDRADDRDQGGPDQGGRGDYQYKPYQGQGNEPRN